MGRVKINQVYVAPMMAGRVLRRIRILAYHPDGGYLYEVMYSINEGEHGEAYKITDLSLNRAYKLEVDVCEHKGNLVEDAYVSTGGYDPAIPNYYRCTGCGDLFPNTGDTDLWFPKRIESKVDV